MKALKVSGAGILLTVKEPRDVGRRSPLGLALDPRVLAVQHGLVGRRYDEHWHGG